MSDHHKNHPRNVIYSLGDHWIVKENVPVGYLQENYVLVSSYGLYVIFEQEISGQVHLTAQDVLIDNKSQNPTIKMVQHSIKKFERQVGISAHPILLYKHLHSLDDASSTKAMPIQEWEFGGIKILTWDSLQPYLFSRWKATQTRTIIWNSRLPRIATQGPLYLRWSELMRICKRLKTVE